MSSDTKAVSEKRTFDQLSAIFDSSNTAYKTKCDQIAKCYSSYREMLSDGNCFYRAIIYGLIENYYNDQEFIEELLRRTKDGCRQMIEKYEYSPLAVEDIIESLTNLLEYFRVPRTQQELDKVLGDLRNDSTIDLGGEKTTSFDYLIAAIRTLVSCYIRSHAQDFNSFIHNDWLDFPNNAPINDEDLSPAEFVKRFAMVNVEPMGCEADHVHVYAVVQAFNLPLTIAYMDRSQGEFQRHTFVPSKSQNAMVVDFPIKIHLLYRPSHYDLLYA